jgi:hypothetical protein
LKVTEIQRKNQQAIKTTGNADDLDAESAKKLKTEVANTKRSVSELKAKVTSNPHHLLLLFCFNNYWFLF